MEYIDQLHIKVHPKKSDGTGVLYDVGIEGATLTLSDNEGVEKSFVYLPNEYLEFLFEWLAGFYLDDVESAQDAKFTKD